MSVIIGIDEAGYGPNLGPLVIAATVWEVPETPFDFWAAFEGVVSNQSPQNGRAFHIADSKQVHASAAGIGPLERSATALLHLAGQPSANLFSLWDGLAGDSSRAGCGEPWFEQNDLTLPVIAPDGSAAELLTRWRNQCERAGCSLRSIACAILPAARFNAAVTEAGTKGRVLSEATLNLLRRVWDCSEPALVFCDKHGGRDRYGDLLATTFPDSFPIGLEESRAVSRYRVGAAEIRFGVRSESQLPVAAASIIAKYLRELSMEAFNRYWQQHHAEIKPTKGYPVDAKRFLEQIAATAESLGLERTNYWRSR